jgi:hypothetical protein
VALTDQAYTARIPVPHLIVRGTDTTISCPVYLSGSLVVPTSGTVSVYDDGGNVVVNAAAVTITDSIAVYSVLGATTSSYSLADGWSVRWSITLTGGAVVTPRSDAALIRQAVYPVISDVDVYRRVPALDPSSQSVITRSANYQSYLDEAWTTIQLRLIGLGERPWLVMSPSALRDPHLMLTLALIFEDLASRINPAYSDRAAAYRQDYEAAWRQMSYRYDTDDDGTADDKGARRSAVGSLWLVGR